MVQKITTALAVAFSATLVTGTAIDRRIVGGEDAEEGQFPSIVRVYPMSRDAGGILARAANLTVHPDYTGKKTIPEGLGTQYAVILNDIAILKLSTPIEENGDTIRYASLPESGSDPEADSKATVAGWGDLNFGGRIPETLRHVVVPIIGRENCAKDLETIVCAGEEGKDSCSSDSGGPLFEQETGKLIGIVSNGFQCATAIGGRYTRVASYIPFINENREGRAGVQFPHDDDDGCDQGKAFPGPQGTVCIGPNGEIFGPPQGEQQQPTSPTGQDCPPFPACSRQLGCTEEQADGCVICKPECRVG
ncbi:hypothetical protein LMH87_001825 [Akanthomyces muscarius]|uniref:Peptidase S1 domain-containing protein n=1 Tax=Akanthomyces muscarius TaxID=2231603 RepID=A0A9W8UGH9_AKAMU|nr:hypothetical protein LMH87_001825 [Akanthomyces muscarius]KAJ4147291.1 hypothetical protein LMH87_001825 [Akanthomyces muscarius]